MGNVENLAGSVSRWLTAETQSVLDYFGLLALLFAGAVLTAVIVRSRHLKVSPSTNSLFSESALVITPLKPDGPILVRGELFFAESVHGDTIPSSSKVKIVGSRNHLLLVQPHS